MMSSVQSSQLLLEVAARKIHIKLNCGKPLFVVETAVAFSKTFEGTCYIALATFLQKELI